MKQIWLVVASCLLIVGCAKTRRYNIHLKNGTLISFVAMGCSVRGPDMVCYSDGDVVFQHPMDDLAIHEIDLSPEDG